MSAQGPGLPMGLRIPDSLPACHGHMCVGSKIVARVYRCAMNCTIGKLAQRICQALSDAVHRHVARARRFRAKVVPDHHSRPPFRCLRSRPPPPARCISPQGLLTPPRRKATKSDVLDTIRRMAQLQIDTIHVVARSPYLVLFSRLGDFAAVARRTSRRGAPVRILVARSVLPAGRAVRPDALQDARSVGNGLEIRGRMA